MVGAGMQANAQRVFAGPHKAAHIAHRNSIQACSTGAMQEGRAHSLQEKMARDAQCYPQAKRDWRIAEPSSDSRYSRRHLKPALRRRK